METTCENYSPWSQEPNSICLIGECIWFEAFTHDCACVDNINYRLPCIFKDGAPDEKR